ncbi:apolipoprotein D-like [Macrobrachium nipponense]|uniref:apolipoprotein D-like n=1 Tax=Macrobrachium nipponense TaxID=159736 RepID=UPI0030C85DC7
MSSLRDLYMSKTLVPDLNSFELRTKMLALLIAVGTLASCTRATIVGHADIGVCPNITEKYDFDPVPYLGRWYETQRFSALFEDGQDCVNAIYEDMGDGYVKVHNMGRSASGELMEIIGKAHLIAPGVLSVEFPGHGAGDYHVLDTDYETFSCVYSCGQVGPLRVEYAWLLTRNVIVDEALVERANQVFTKNGIDVSNFQPTHQGDDCPYAV